MAALNGYLFFPLHNQTLEPIRHNSGLLLLSVMIKWSSVVKDCDDYRLLQYNSFTFICLAKNNININYLKLEALYRCQPHFKEYTLIVLSDDIYLPYLNVSCKPRLIRSGHNGLKYIAHTPANIYSYRVGIDPYHVFKERPFILSEYVNTKFSPQDLSCLKTMSIILTRVWRYAVYKPLNDVNSLFIYKYTSYMGGKGGR